MLTVEQALESILTHVRALPAEPVPITQALGRTLAQRVMADIDNPPFDNSAVDGYAVLAADTVGATPETPAILREVADVPAGSFSAARLGAGECARVMTGAPIPNGADAMVMVEDTERTANGVAIKEPARAGDHVRMTGEDVRAGAEVLTAEAVIGPAEVAMLAAMGQAVVSCIRRPRVAVLSTGDELVEITRKPGPGQIRDSNRYTLGALALDTGSVLVDSRCVPDDEAATEEAFRACAGLDGGPAADVIVTSGGVSVGDRDFVKPVLERLGTLEMWRVRMKPGKPLAFGRIGASLFFGLPGNPISTMVTFELFVRPALRRMAGHEALHRPRVMATLDNAVSHVPGRREYVRARVRLQDSVFVATPTGAQGSGMLSSMTGANALLVIPDESKGLRKGDSVEAVLLHLEATG